MTYPTMLLCLDDDRPADARTAQAIRLARREGDHLAGLSCRRPSLFRAPVATAAGGSADLLATEMEAARLLATARERRFVSLCEREALASFALDVDDALEPGLALLERAPVHDLLILGQPDPSEPEAARRREVVERVLQHNPRPTLLLPYAGAVEEIGRSVVVAWDGSHGSARAAADALPLLRQARSVQLLYFDGSGGATLAVGDTPLGRAKAWLERHGVAAQARVSRTTIGIGDALLSHVADAGADLLVMGAWGHARWKERLLGGATRTILDSMTLPVLASH